MNVITFVMEDCHTKTFVSGIHNYKRQSLLERKRLEKDPLCGCSCQNKISVHVSADHLQSQKTTVLKVL
jgi:hypothetical protein